MPKRGGKRAPGSPAKKPSTGGTKGGAKGAAKGGSRGNTGKRAKPKGTPKGAKQTTKGSKPTKKSAVAKGGKKTTKGAKKGTKKGPKGLRRQDGRKPIARKRPGKRPRRAAVDAAPHPDGERLQKILAAAGLASRRECETLIAEGRVQVDGETVTELGVRVDPTKQTIHVDGEALRQPKRVYYAVNKPTGVVCTARDPSGRPRVTDLLPPTIGRVFNVGRLDMASEGLILVTNDGELANKLTHPRHGVEKLYQVQVAGRPTPEALAEVRRGVYLDEGRVSFAHIKIKSHRKSSTLLEVTLDEGRNREIRRVLARVGHKVQRLQRVAVGPVKLGEMPAGAYRQLTREEISALRDTADRGPKKKEKAIKAADAKQDDQKTKRPPRKPAPKPAPEKKPASGRRIIGAD